MQRINVKEGRRVSDSGTSSDTATPIAQEVGSEEPQIVEEKRGRSASDLEKGLNESEDGSVDVKGEKDRVGEGHVEKS